MRRVFHFWALSIVVVALSVLPVSANPVLFVSNATGVISEFTLTGTPLGTPLGTGTFTIVPGQTAGLAVRNQTLYVADYTGNPVRPFAADGTPLTTLAHGLGPYGTSGMAFDTSGNLFVSDQLEKTIRKFSPDGTHLGVFAAGLGDPWGLAFDAGGNLYAANRSANVITKYAANGTLLGVFTSAWLDQPIGIAFDALGHLFVANFGNSKISQFSSVGVDLGLFASDGLSKPTEITFDDAGNLYVANWGNSTVRLYAANGTDLGYLVTGGLSQPQGIAIRRDAVVYSATIQPPINGNGSSVFNAKRGVVSVKFTLAVNGAPTCQLPAATISLERTAGGTLGAINESEFVQSADTGSNFRIDTTNCQYVYNLGSDSLGVGTYVVRINIANVAIGTGTFSLRIWSETSRNC